MALRILWDNEEAAILLDAYLKTCSGVISRKDAVSSVSNDLRQRAVNKGIAIDDIFRNENGISMQMSIMEYGFTDGQHGLKQNPIPNPFQYVINLYRSNRTDYEKILKEARQSVSGETSTEKRFAAWLADKVSAIDIPGLLAVFPEIESFCFQRGILKKGIFATNELDVINSINNVIDSNTLFRIKYRKRLRVMRSAIGYYYEFTKSALNENIEVPLVEKDTVKDGCSGGEKSRKTRRISVKDIVSPILETPNNKEKETVSGRIAHAESNIDISNETKTEFEAVLFKHFKENGYQPGNDFSAVMFKCCYSAEFDSVLNKTSDEIDKIIKIIGAEHNGRIFPKKTVEETNALIKAEHMMKKAEAAKGFETDETAQHNSCADKTNAKDNDTEQKIKEKPAANDDSRTNDFYRNENQETKYIRSKEANTEIETKEYAEASDKARICKPAAAEFDKKPQRKDSKGTAAAENIKKETQKNRIAFDNWLKEHEITGDDALNHILDVGKCSRFAVENGVCDSELWLIHDTAELKQIEAQLLVMEEFSKHNKATNGRYKLAIDTFIQFRSGEINFSDEITTHADTYTQSNASNTEPTEQSDEINCEESQKITKAESNDAPVQTYQNKNTIEDDKPEEYAETARSRGKENRVNFIGWMQDAGMSNPSVFACISVIGKCSRYAQEKGICSSELWSIDDISELKKIEKRLFAMWEVKELNRKHNNRYKSAYDNLIQFYEEKNDDLHCKTSVPSDLPVSSIKRGAIAAYCVSKYNQRALRALGYSSYGDFYGGVGKKIGLSSYDIKKFKEDMDPYLNRSCHKPLKRLSEMEKEIIDTFERYTDDKTIQLVKQILSDNQKSKPDVSVRTLKTTRSNTVRDIPVDGIQQEFNYPDIQETKSKYSDTIKSRYAKILSQYFGEDGYQLGRAIFRGRFKNYYSSEFGCDVDNSDEEIDEIMRLVGTERDARIFPKQDEEQNGLIENIVNDIFNTLNKGISAVYIDAVYDKYENELADSLQIYNSEALDSMVLKNAKGHFTKRYSYYVFNGNNADSENDILHVMKECYEPRTYDEIHELTWYIPYDQMKKKLAAMNSVVNVAPETYFYAPNLPVNSAELTQIKSVIQTELNYCPYITDSELIEKIYDKCPGVAVDTSHFTKYGLRNCLGYIFREEFTFKGPIISAVGSDFKMSDVFAEFARQHETLEFSELKEFANELDTGIYWNSIINEMIRVSEHKLVRRDMIQFDSTVIDNVLDSMCPGSYIPLKNVTLFLHFPNIGYRWNQYVLESYLYCGSKKFKLIHSSFGNNSVCGAMVRADSSINDYRDLIVDALSKSDALGSAKKALQYITDCGFQKRQKYNGIEQIVREAKLIKERREKEN